ncbi:hypothetical protein [uncultured Akkermansia sp.]|uniref:hypothetical protein n=1 Tax=uncultured Akkermansia sp. TaxID=512294 RepID=UPI0026369CA5|nr:hypothetical protein [uncultured Akkermansia sp.]
MKTLQCPLCGKILDLNDFLYHKEHMGYGCHEYETAYFYECPDCQLSTEWATTPEEALKYAENLISKFPPFMRVHQGNNLKLDFNDDILTVIGKDTDRGKLYLENCRGDVEIATPDDVDQWPWELKQKGGDE